MQYFKDFAEDYNTATMPHPKFYNYEKWEIEEYQRKQRQAQSNESSAIPTFFNDEEMVKQNRKRQKEEEERLAFQALRQRMAVDKNLQEDMKRQQQLTVELQQAYKRGDTATVKRLEKLLAPDEMTGTIKHPWA